MVESNNSSLVQNTSSGLPCQTQPLGPKIGTLTSAAIEANNFKLGFGEKIVKTTTKTQIGWVLSRTPKVSGPL